MTSDFASGFRAGVEAAKEALEDLAVRAKTALRIRCDRCGTTYIEGERHGCAQQPDAAPSDFVATMREIRSELTAAGITVDAAAFARERNLDPAATAWRALSSGERATILQALHSMRRVGGEAAWYLLRSLAPEAGDDR